MKIVLLLLFIFSLDNFCVTAQELLVTQTSTSETQGEILEFKSIKAVLENDMLDVELEKKQAINQQKQDAIEKRKMGQYNIPAQEEFWTFFSEYWLVKNAPVLKWDFEKPDYGLDESFTSFLEKQGHYEKKFKILLLNTPAITHFGLPSDKGEYIFLLSVPFIRTLDLSKMEISILLFENLLRLDSGYFQSFVATKDLQDLWGTNFLGKKLHKKVFVEMLANYDKIIFEKGFDYKQQFEVTRALGRIFKSDMSLWNAYFGLLKKIDALVKSNALYTHYLKIYPSPEMQMRWLSPEVKNDKRL